MIRKIMVNRSCLTINLEEALFPGQGEMLWLDDSEPVVERLDGTTVRLRSSSAAVNRSFRLL